MEKRPENRKELLEAKGDNDTEQRELPKALKILVVEDQGYPKIIVLNAIKSSFGEALPDFRNGGDLTLIDNMVDLRNTLGDKNFDYDMVFLDNRILAEPFDRSNEKKDKDFYYRAKFKQDDFDVYRDSSEFMDAPKANAYSMIGEIQAKKAAVIGTSSMDERDLQSLGVQRPDFFIEKSFDKAEKTLEEIRGPILSKIKENE